MKVSIKCLAPMLLTLWPLVASAQTNDVAYCKALAQKYETYVANMSTSRSAQSADGRMAVSECDSANPAKGIAVLEQKLRNAKVDLPPRG